MPRHINAAFNEICPADQVWKIDLLELDLGTIAYKDLECELSKQLANILREQLGDIVLHAGKRGSTGIGITIPEMSALGVLESFLLTGLMPWNYQHSYGTVDQLMQAQLSNNTGGVMQLVKKLGIDENVRKRIAWQLTDGVIFSIVKELEPASHGEVFRFYEEIKVVQKKNSIVKSGSSDFKRNLFLWMLNYLLVERGTLFNKLAFIKSSIKQMADHYNVRYVELLLLIETAVEKVNESIPSGLSFLKTLRLLSGEHKGTLTKDNPVTVDYNERLAAFFEHLSKQRAGRAGNTFKVLMAELHETDARQLFSLLFSFRQSDLFWKNLEMDAPASFLQALSRALNRETGGNLAKITDLLYNAMKSHELAIDKAKLCYAGIEFLCRHSHTVFDKQHCIRYVIQYAGKIKNISPGKICAAVMIADMTAGNEFASDVHADLHQVCRSQYGDTLPVVLESNLHDLFNKFATRENRIAAPFFSSSPNDHLQRSLQIDPGAFWRSLLSFPDKKLLTATILYRLSIADINLLLEKSGNSKGKFLLSFLQLLKKEGSAIHTINQSLCETLPLAGLKIMLLYPQLSSARFLQLLMKGLVFEFDQKQLQEVLDLFVSLAGSDNSSLSEAGKAIRSIVTTGYLKKRYAPGDRVVNRYLDYSPGLIQNQLQFLTNHFGAVPAEHMEEMKVTKGKILLNRLRKNGSILLDTLMHKYCAGLKEHKFVQPELTRKQLEELFWGGVIKHKDFDTDADELEHDFELAVRCYYRLPATVISHTQKISIEETGTTMAVTASCLQQDALVRACRKGLTSGCLYVTYRGKRYTTGSLLLFAIRKDPYRFRLLFLLNGNLKKTVAGIKQAISFSGFSFWVLSDCKNEWSIAMTALCSLHHLAMCLEEEGFIKIPEDAFWDTAIDLVRKKERPAVAVEKMLTIVLGPLHPVTTEKQAYIEVQIEKMKLPAGSLLLKVMHEKFPLLASKNDVKKVVTATVLAPIEEAGLEDELIKRLLKDMRLPSWYKPAMPISAGELFIQLLQQHPQQCLVIMAQVDFTSRQVEWLNNKVGIYFIVEALKKTAAPAQMQLATLEELYKSFGKLAIKGITCRQIQLILFKKIWRAWQLHNWQLLSAESIWKELLWEITMLYSIPKESFITDVHNQRALLPVALQAAFSMLYSNAGADTGIIVQQKPSLSARVGNKLTKPYIAIGRNESITVKNAGIVLLNNYIPLLFERLSIMEKSRIFREGTQQYAVHYLQYLVTGLTQTEEFLLPLNKILCGLPLSTPVENQIEISTGDKDLMDGLIKAAISYWPAIGNTSVQGFRGNWLVRDGLLSEADEHWQLLVDKRSYDVLIGKLPFSFSVIKFPWMTKPLKVTWPY